MSKRLFAAGFAGALLAAVAACGGGAGGASPPSSGGGGGGPTGVGALTIGFALPTGTIGTVIDPRFGLVGGYTQSTYSQVIGFPTGTTITLKNLSASTTHTLNVVGTTAFPAAGTPLSSASSGTANLDANFSSGPLAGGQSMQVTLNTAGTFYIGCAFHYPIGMRDVIVVAANAAPGPQATPEGGTSGGNGGGNGY
jgi:plastocyanin